MGRALALAMLVFVAPAVLSGQTLAVLHIRAVLTDPAGQSTPVARHALLISDNPPTREPRRIVTTVDGTADVRLRPGSYTVESDQPIAFQGTAYHWTRTVEVVAGRDSTLELTSANAATETIEAARANGGAPANDAAPPVTDPSLLLRPWFDSIVELWTPTAHASGFLVDAAGLIVTNQQVVADATSIEVQLSRSVKVAATVLEADRQRDVAVIRIDPSVMASIKPVPLGCAPTAPSPLKRGQEIYALAAPLRQEKGMSFGEVSRVDLKSVATDLRLATGGTGGPVFTASGDVAGLTSLPDERDEPRRGATIIIRIQNACDVVASAAKKARDGAAPSAAHLPVEPRAAAPVAEFKEAVKKRAGSLKPYQMPAADFDVAFIPPILNYAAQTQFNVNFANWADYLADVPPLLFIRVTPKMVEGVLGKVARGAAATQGVALPAMKRLKTGFLRLQALCGSNEVLPVHPFKLELRVSETDTLYEGLYGFDPASLAPACGTVTLVLYSEKEPGKADTRIVDPKLLQQVWRDLGLAPTP